MSHPVCSTDANDAVAIASFWGSSRLLRLAGQRSAPKQPSVAVTVQCSPEVVEYFTTTGYGWQARMNDVLLEYVKQHCVSPKK